MQIPAFFGRKKSINLLPRDAFENSRLGIILAWTLQFGKWAVIVTQLIVMGTFLWRFTLDRKLTDLKKEIAKSIAIIKSYEKIENEFVVTSRRVATITEIDNSQKRFISTMNFLNEITPADVRYEKIALSENNISLAVISESLVSFGRLLTNIQTSNAYDSIIIGKIQNSGSQKAEIQFDLTLKHRERK